jgi:hypothetical protein
MSTSKDNLEMQIKKQMEEREIEPSRDLWSEIQQQSGNSRSSLKAGWFLVAACMVMVLGLGSILFLSREKPVENSSKIADKENKPSAQQPLIISDRKDSLLMLKDNKRDAIENKGSQETKENINSPLVAIDHKMTIREPIAEKKIVPISYSQTKIIAQVDTVKVPGKKKKYVDPETLLFSVEHKDVIEKTKESKVATIDLNGK